MGNRLGSTSDPAPTTRQETDPDLRPLSGAKLTRLLVGSTPKTRLAIRLWSIATLCYALYLAILGVQVLLGFASTQAFVVTGAITGAGSAVLYGLLRNNLFARWGIGSAAGPAQLAYGMVLFWLNYAVSGPAAPSTTIIAASNLLYGAFSLSPRRMWQLTLIWLTSLVVLMLACHQWRPDRFPADVQVVTFLYTAVTLPLVARLAGIISTMQRNLRQRTQDVHHTVAALQRLAACDDLTQLYNRRHVTELLNEELARLSPGPGGVSGRLSLALLDLDHFKAVNDDHGHAAGDLVLQRFADTVRRTCRSTDLVARWGGEEFLVAFQGLSIDGAERSLLRLGETLRTTDFADIAPDLRVRFSAGLVEASPGDDLRQLLADADRALYRAKHGGRDRIEVAGRSADEPALTRPAR